MLYITVGSTLCVSLKRKTATSLTRTQDHIPPILRRTQPLRSDPHGNEKVLFHTMPINQDREPVQIFPYFHFIFRASKTLLRAENRRVIDMIRTILVNYNVTSDPADKLGQFISIKLAKDFVSTLVNAHRLRIY